MIKVDIEGVDFIVIKDRKVLQEYIKKNHDDGILKSWVGKAIIYAPNGIDFLSEKDFAKIAKKFGYIKKEK